jgi:enoyl-CoA hydratase
MTSYDDILIDRVGTDGRVARITLNRPAKLNALSSQSFGELGRACRDLEADDDVRVVIIRGAGRAFSVGHDLSGGLSSISPDGPRRTYTLTDERGRALAANHATALRQATEIQMFVWGMAKVTIMQTHGYCLAGGMELAMMGDLLTTSTDCQFGHPGHRGVGVARNAMLLPLIVGMRKGKELFLTGDPIDGIEAERLGIANYAWPADELDDRTIALADRIANQSADFLGVLKSTFNRFYENMNIHSSVLAATQADALIQSTRSGYAWDDVIAEQGLKKALAWRDGPYGDYGSTPSQRGGESS